MTNTQDAGESRTPEQIAQLHEVQAAKAQLASLTPAEVRAALEYRRGGIGEAQ
ncbi:hypothetical protein [Nocardioides daeguensis]|nr:hypothetical protein [Nocardioides daeguensis]MBV6728206.1 hypothetical protein [Nocardioides daeguensis]MCR1773016.1 hypothetical protein [Nocardioides daeguensis]